MNKILNNIQIFFYNIIYKINNDIYIVKILIILKKLKKYITKIKYEKKRNKKKYNKYKKKCFQKFDVK